MKDKDKMENKYKSFIGMVQKTNDLMKARQEAYKNPTPSISDKGIASSLYDKDNQEYKDYLLSKNSSSEEISSVLTEGVNQTNQKVKNAVENDLESIISDAPDEITEFAAENVAPYRTKNKEHDVIVNAHEKYIQAKTLLKEYRTPKTRVEARKEILKKVHKVYDERYAEDEETRKFMKDLSTASSRILQREYIDVIARVKEEFDKRLEGKEAKYLFKNIETLDDKSSFVGFLISRDKRQLIQTAISNGHLESAEMLSDEMKEDIESEIENQSPEEIRNILMHQYDNGNGNGTAVKVAPWMQRATQNVPMNDYAA